MNQRALFKLTVDQAANQVVFLLSGAGRSREASGELSSQTLQVAESLPARTNCSVYFLGSSKRYSLAELQADGWPRCEANSRSVSLIGPILRSFTTEQRAWQIVMIGVSRVFDLEDWELATPAWAIDCADDLTQCQHVPSWHELRERMVDPVERVELAEPYFMPTTWDNAAYQLALENETWVLRGTDAVNLDVTVAGIALAERPLTARLVHRSARQTLRQLAAVGLEEDDAGVVLADHEAAVFRAMARGRTFRCPNCERMHAGFTLHCDNDASPEFRFRGRPVFRSLDRLRKTGLYRARDDGDRVQCTFAGQAWVDRNRQEIYLLLNLHQIYRAKFAACGIDTSSLHRLSGGCIPVGSKEHVFLYH